MQDHQEEKTRESRLRVKSSRAKKETANIVGRKTLCYITGNGNGYVCERKRMRVKTKRAKQDTERSRHNNNER